MNLAIYGLDSCNSISIKENTNFYGAIYARNAFIEILEGVAIYGSIVGETLDIKEYASIHYDEALKDPAKNPDALTYDYYVIRQWKEIQ